MSWRDEIIEVTCSRCGGEKKIDAPGGFGGLTQKCWKCHGAGTLSALIESSTKVLIYPETEKWYAWWYWNIKTNPRVLKEMKEAQNHMKPYPVDTEWPPEPKSRSKPNGGK